MSYYRKEFSSLICSLMLPCKLDFPNIFLSPNNYIIIIVMPQPNHHHNMSKGCHSQPSNQLLVDLHLPSSLLKTYMTIAHQIAIKYLSYLVLNKLKLEKNQPPIFPPQPTFPLFYPLQNTVHLLKVGSQPTSTLLWLGIGHKYGQVDNIHHMHRFKCKSSKTIC